MENWRNDISAVVINNDRPRDSTFVSSIMVFRVKECTGNKINQLTLYAEKNGGYYGKLGKIDIIISDFNHDRHFISV